MIRQESLETCSSREDIPQVMAFARAHPESLNIQRSFFIDLITFLYPRDDLEFFEIYEISTGPMELIDLVIRNMKQFPDSYSIHHNGFQILSYLCHHDHEAWAVNPMLQFLKDKCPPKSHDFYLALDHMSHIFHRGYNKQNYEVYITKFEELEGPSFIIESLRKCDDATVDYSEELHYYYSCLDSILGYNESIQTKAESLGLAELILRDLRKVQFYRHIECLCKLKFESLSVELIESTLQFLTEKLFEKETIWGRDGSLFYASINFMYVVFKKHHDLLRRNSVILPCMFFIVLHLIHSFPIKRNK